MLEREVGEAIIDRLLLLYLVARTRQKGYNILGQIKLQKLLYKTQERMYLSKYKGLNYNFVRWKFGPFSQEIYSDVEDLKTTGFLNRRQEVSLTPKGEEMISALDSVFDKVTRDIVDRVINEFGPYTGRQIKKVMYSYGKVGERKTIEQAKMGELLLSKLKPKDAQQRLCINEKLLETLRFLFDPASNKALRKGLQALKTEKCREFIPVRQ